MGYERVLAEMQGLDISCFIASTDPAEFMDFGAQLLQEADHMKALNSLASARGERAIAAGFIEHILDTALTKVQSDVEGQRQAVTAIEMLQGAGTKPSRVRTLRAAARCAANYHVIKDQLEAEPESPIISLFVNNYEADHHCGITIQSAHSTGAIRWRNDPHRDEVRRPELIIATQQPVDPLLSRLEEQATLDIRRRILRLGVHKAPSQGKYEAPHVIVGDRSTVLTDTHDPPYLLLPSDKKELGWEACIGEAGSDDYQQWIFNEFGIDSTFPANTHLFAIGSSAIERLVARMGAEIVPYMRTSTPASLPETKRLLRSLTLVAEAAQTSPNNTAAFIRRNIKEDTWNALAVVLREVLSRSHHPLPDKSESDVPQLIKACHAAGVLFDLGSIARRALVSVRQKHEAGVVTEKDLLEAVEGELQQAIEFAHPG